MGIFRKRPAAREPELGKLLDGYEATRPPAPTHSMVESVICWRCRKPNVFDARLARPKTCAWCRAAL
jgi:hypothetical protein